MQAVVIGLGSMGRRRVRLLRECDDSIKIYGVDTRQERRKQVAEEFGIMTYQSLYEVCENVTVDMAFVSSSPLSHAGLIADCLKRDINVFSEINLVDTGYDENIQEAEKRSRVLFLSSTFLYRREIGYIKDTVSSNKGRFSYIYHVGQYLPDWHPWEDYRGFFACGKKTNGCRELMAIEFPWLFKVFGMPVSWKVSRVRNSSLEIDYPDTYGIILEHEKALGLVEIDVVTRKSVRKFELSGEDLYLTWDGTPEGLVEYDFEDRTEKKILLYSAVNKRDDYNASIIEDAYKSEIEEFIATIQGESRGRYSFEEDRKIIKIIDQIEGTTGT